jgi:hypothetical protein
MEEGGIINDKEIELVIQDIKARERHFSLEDRHFSLEDQENTRKGMQKTSNENKIKLENYQNKYPIQTYTGTREEILDKFIHCFDDETSWEGFTQIGYFHIYTNNNQLEVCENSKKYPFIQIITNSNNQYKFEKFKIKFSEIYIENTDKTDIYDNKMYMIEVLEQERLALQKEIAKLRSQLVHEGLAKNANHPNKIAKLLDEDEDDVDLDSKI